MTSLQIGEAFPDFELPDHNGKLRRLSAFTRPSTMDTQVGFEAGYPTVLVFYRGFFCPRDQQQMRLLVQFQNELAVNYCSLLAVAVQPPMVQAAFRAGLGASFTFLADAQRKLIQQIGILDETEGEYADPARPFTFVLKPDLSIHAIYDGWYFVGRPTLEELRADLRSIMQQQPYYPYDVWNTRRVKKIRIPQHEWRTGTPDLGANDLPVAEGIVRQFDYRSGNGLIESSAGQAIFFNFTAIPGEGYRTIQPGTTVRFEIVENETGPSARNIQVASDGVD